MVLECPGGPLGDSEASVLLWDRSKLTQCGRSTRWQCPLAGCSGMFIYCFRFIQLWFKTANEARPADHKAWPVRGDTNKQAQNGGSPAALSMLSSTRASIHGDHLVSSAGSWFCEQQQENPKHQTSTQWGFGVEAQSTDFQARLPKTKPGFHDRSGPSGGLRQKVSAWSLGMWPHLEKGSLQLILR